MAAHDIGGRPRLYARLDHQTGSDHLLVCFNSYDSAAEGHRTRLENFGWLSALDVSTLWFAEAGPRGWYTAFDREIQRWILETTERQRIRRVTLLGSSCGAYASLRHAWLLTGAPRPLDVRAIAINPQTGFDAPLLVAIRTALVRAGWPATELGTNPIVPDPGDLCSAADSVPISDLLELATALSPTDAPPRLHLLFDALNPIDQGWCGRLGGLPGVVLQPHRLGLGHADGARWFWQSEAFRQLVRRSVAPQEPGAEIVRLERIRLLQRHAALQAA